MKVMDKLHLNRDGLEEYGPVNIVIFGDSVSHGAVVDNLDYENVYWNRLRKMLNAYRDYVPVNMINASVGGTTAHSSLKRLDRDVLQHRPDLVIVAFGLNDVNHPFDEYVSALQEIFSRCIATGCDVILLTPNMLNTYVAADTAPRHLEYAKKTAQLQNDGTMDRYIGAAVRLAENMGVTVCDCYGKWKELSHSQDTTMLLANRINHPVPEMHKLFADSLFELIITDREPVLQTESTMYRG